MNIKWLLFSIFFALVGCSSTTDPLYTCNNGTQFTVSHTEEQATEMVMAHKRILLQQVPAASGSKYENSERDLMLWLKGKRAMVTLGSDTILNCDQTSN